MSLGSEVPIGAVWHKVYEFLPVKNDRIIVYNTGIADGTANDEPCKPSKQKRLVDNRRRIVELVGIGPRESPTHTICAKPPKPRI